MSTNQASSLLPLEIILGKLSVIALQVQQSRELGGLIQDAIATARELLQADRVIIYRFLPGGNVVVAFESVGDEWNSILAQVIDASCLNAAWLEHYKQGQTTAITEIDPDQTPACYIEWLDRIQVQANLVVPIFSQGNLWGLLIAHHCCSARYWQPLEIQVLQHIAIHLSLAIQQTALHQQLHRYNDPTEATANQHPDQHPDQLTTQQTTQTSPTGAALQQSQALLAEARRVAHIGSWEYDLMTQKITWTEEVFHLFNRDPARGEPTYDEHCYLCHSEDWAKLQQAVARAITLGESYNLVLRVPQPDGSTHYLETVGKAGRDARGQVVRLYGTAQDVTERKLAEFALQRSEEQRRFILDATQLGLWDWNIATGELIWTDNTFRLLGYAPGEVKPTHAAWRDRVHPDDLEALNQALMREMESQTGGEVKYRVYFPDGSLHWLWGKRRVIFAESGEPVRMVGVVMDITDRELNEADRQQREELIQNIAQGVSATTGTAFFHSLVRYLLRSLEVDQAFVGELVVPQKDRLKIIAGSSRSSDSQLLDGFEYPITGTPCEQVVTHGFCLYPEQVQQLFPAATELQAIGGQGYVGIPLVNAAGEVMGLIGVISYEPLVNAQFTEEVLTIFAARAASELERQQSEVLLRRYERIISATPDCVALLDRNYIYQVINQTYLKWNNKSYGEIVGHSVSELLGQEFFETACKPLLDRCLIEGSSQVIEAWLNYDDGQRRFVRAHYAPYVELDGTISGVVINVHNLTDLKLAEEALADSEERFRQMAASIHEVFWMADINFTQMLYVSPAYEKIWGRSCATLYAEPRSFLELIHPDDYAQVLTTIDQYRYSGFSHEYRLLRPDGTICWIGERAFPVLDTNEQPYRLVGISQDITARKQTEAQLIYSAFHDALTDLPNRDLLMQRLELAIHNAQQSAAYCFAVLFMDLDQFKVINDSLGHLVGDQLLITIARKLKSIIRTTDLVARLGGDEFVVLLEEIDGIQDAIWVAERIFTELQDSPVIGGRTVFTSASIGIVLGNQAYHEASHLLRDADIAMYRAKVRGRARYEIFDTEMHTQALKRMHLENDLRRAIEQQEFVIYYQPIVALNTRHLVGFEALVRWQHPTRGLILPGEFISIAEETGLIVLLDRWLLRSACLQLAAWHQQFPQNSTIKVSVNLSGRNLREPHLVEMIGQILAETGIERNCLTLEITESMLIENIETAIDVLSQLRNLGVQISIDDFGTGYSSLSYLYRLPIDTLKIDQSFVSCMQTSSSRNHKIIQTIITLSHQLGLGAIAEGIETQQQLQWLQELGCELGQGYFFAKPMGAEAAATFLSLYHD